LADPVDLYNQYVVLNDSKTPKFGPDANLYNIVEYKQGQVKGSPVYFDLLYGSHLPNTITFSSQYNINKGKLKV
jgi:hypothetical protein